MGWRALVGYVVLAVAFTWPLVLQADDHVIGPFKGDNFEYVWKVWWVAHALQEGDSPFTQPDVYYPHGYPLAYGEITPIHTFFKAPLTLLTSATFSYNTAILLSVVLSGWITYGFAKDWLRHNQINPSEQFIEISAFIAGAAFAVCAYRMQRIAGHLPLIDTQWLVLAFWFFERWLRDGKWRNAVVMGIAIGLSALSSWYYALMLLLVMPIYMLYRVNVLQLIRQPHAWFGVGMVTTIVAVMAGPFLLPYLDILGGDSSKVPLDQASFWAASPLDYLMPNASHPIWGSMVQTVMWPIPGIDMPVEFIMTVGWFLLVFGWMGWKHLKGGQWRALKAMMVVSFILSLGPFLHIGRLPTPLPLPVLLLRELPVADGVRTWGRFSILVTLGMVMLAAPIIQHQLIKTQTNFSLRRAHWMGGGLLALCLFLAWTGPAELVKIEGRPVDTWLADQPDDVIIMQYPISDALSGPAMLYTRYHGKKVVFGYGTYFPFLFEEEYPELYDFPDDTAIDQLTEWNVRYILISVDNLDEDNEDSFTIKEVEQQPRLRYIDTFDDQAVYELVR